MSGECVVWVLRGLHALAGNSALGSESFPLDSTDFSQEVTCERVTVQWIPAPLKLINLLWIFFFFLHRTSDINTVPYTQVCWVVDAPHLHFSEYLHNSLRELCILWQFVWSWPTSNTSRNNSMKFREITGEIHTTATMSVSVWWVWMIFSVQACLDQTS